LKKLHSPQFPPSHLRAKCATFSSSGREHTH
jgi:hypothetical protein